MTTWRRVLVCALLLTGVAARARAQIGAGQLTGIVLDPSGAAVPGATVTVTDISRDFSRTVVTQAEGGYTVAALLPSVYRIDVMLTGFQPLRREGVEVRTGENIRLDLTLTVGNGQERVIVAAAAPVLRTSSGSLGQVISNESIVGLPLNGRSFIVLTGLAPGVALPPSTTSPLPRINGGRPRTNEYLFDGISVLQPEPGQVAFFPIIDAIEEFKIESNSPPAEFGRFNGGVVNLTTKAGGNSFRGNAWGFLRNEALNARNYFQSTDPVKPEFRRLQSGFTFGGPVRKNSTFFFIDYQGQRQHIDRTLFANVPTLLQRQGNFTEAIGGRVFPIYDPATTTPNGSGGFTRTQFAGNSIPAERIDPVALALLNRYPLPTAIGTANNYRQTVPEQDNQDQFDARVNQRLFEGRDTVFVRVSHFDGDYVPATNLPDGSGTVFPGSLATGPQTTSVWATASSFQHTFSNRWFNEFRLGDTRRTVARTAVQLPGPASATIGLPGIPSNAQFPNTLPTFSISGLAALGSALSTASDFSTSVTEAADSLTYVRGRHSFKMGFDWRWERLNVIQPQYPTGNFTFNNFFTDLPGTTNSGTPLASFMLGQVNTFAIDLQNQAIRNRAHIEEYFIQDEWKLGNRWTLSPGLRYTLNFPSTEVDNQSSVFNQSTKVLDYLGRDGNPTAARELHWGDFAPRLSVAGRITDKTVVSSGYAKVVIEMAGITTPFTTPSFPFVQNASQRTLDNITPAFVLAGGPTVTPVSTTDPLAGIGQGVFAVDRGLGSGYVQQWNVAVQRELTSTIVVEVAYVGSKITRVGLPDANINQLTTDQLALGSVLQEKVPNPYFGIIPRSSSLGDPTITRAQLMKPFPEYTTVGLYRDNIGTTRFDGLTLRVEKRWSRGLNALVSYTRSKLVDDASSVFDASILSAPAPSFPVADSYNRKLDRDYSNGDIPNVLAASSTWDLPWGHGRSSQPQGWVGALANDWTLSGILTLQSGIPLAIAQTTNNNAFAGFGTQRPNQVHDPELPADERTWQKWFDTTAFVAAPIFTLGSSTRNPVRGPSYRNLDLALSRRFNVGTGKTIEARVEAFNAVNTPPLNAPNTTVGNAAFGSINTAGDPRVMQLAVKVGW